MQLVTHQTGPAGQKVQRLLVEEGSAIERELYLGLVLDRASAKIVFMASQSGGMEIEEVAHATPELIYKEYIDPAVGFQPYQARALAFKLGLKPTQINPAVGFMTGLYKAFVDTDSTLMEINPFITTKDGKLVALDCKINFDDNAMFRHKDLKELRDLAEEDPLEVEASKFALNYIKLDGNIACMVNGAGLAMATMDIIEYAGGKAANFLDVGGGANQEQIENAFGILLSRPEREGDLHQHLWRHSAGRCLGHGGGRGGEEAGSDTADHSSAGGYERGRGTEDFGGVGAKVFGGIDDEGSSGSGSCRGERITCVVFSQEEADSLEREGAGVVV